MSLFDDMMASISGGSVGALPPGAFPAPLPSEMEAAKADDAAARWAEKQRKEQAAALLAAQARQRANCASADGSRCASAAGRSGCGEFV